MIPSLTHLALENPSRNLILDRDSKYSNDGITLSTLVWQQNSGYAYIGRGASHPNIGPVPNDISRG
jgi:hypothetical protein